MEPTVYVVEDDTQITELLRLHLSRDNLPAAFFSDAESFLETVPGRPRGCVILDYELGQGLNGLELQERLADAGVDLPVIFLSGKANIATAVKAMHQKAVDFIEKPYEPDEMIALVKKALAEDERRFVNRMHLDEVTRRYRLLSPRETEIMALVVQGLANKQMAMKLSLSEKTIEAHRSAVMRKMQADSLAELVRMSVLLEQHGLAAHEVR